MKTIIVLISFLLSPAVAAQTSGTFTHVDEGEPAPFAGTLMDQQSISTIIVEKRTCKKETLIDCNLKCNIEKETIKKDSNDYKIASDICEQRSAELLKIKEQETDRLREELESNSNDYSLIWFSGGVLGGIALSLTVFYISVQIVGGPSGQ